MFDAAGGPYVNVSLARRGFERPIEAARATLLVFLGSL
jgi:hypothetical protein